MMATRSRYGVVTLAIALAVLSYVQRVAISQAAGPITHDLHLNKAQMGLIFGAFGYPTLCSNSRWAFSVTASESGASCCKSCLPGLRLLH